MRRHHFVAISLAVLCVSLSINAQESHDHGSAPDASAASSTAHRGTIINFASSPGQGSGYLSLPSSKGKHAAVIVIQEWWGVNDWIKEQADRFASQGYVALAP